MEGKIIRHETKDGLILNGLFTERKSVKAILYTHGWAGDFYQNRFIESISNAAANQNMAFLSVQNRGSGHTYDFYTGSGKVKTIGAVHEKIIESIFDIESWLYFLYLKGYKEVTLVGHSLAPHKMALFMYTKQHPMIDRMIFISPVDIFDLFNHMLHQEAETIQTNLQLSKKMIEGGQESQLMPEDTLWYPISAGSFYDHFGPESKLHIFDFNYNPDFDAKVLKSLFIPIMAIVGSADPYLRQKNEFMKKLIAVLPKGYGKIIDKADHGFWGQEKALEDNIVSYLRK